MESCEVEFIPGNLLNYALIQGNPRRIITQFTKSITGYMVTWAVGTRLSFFPPWIKTKKNITKSVHRQFTILVSGEVLQCTYTPVYCLYVYCLSRKIREILQVLNVLAKNSK